MRNNTKKKTVKRTPPVTGRVKALRPPVTGRVKALRPPQTINGYELRYGVPIPPKPLNERRNKWDLDTMVIGSHFLIPVSKDKVEAKKRMTNFISAYRQARKKGRYAQTLIDTRLVVDSGIWNVGVWRVA